MSNGQRIKKLIDRIEKIYVSTTTFIINIILATILILTMTQIIYRYFFRSSIVWIGEISLNLFVFLVFLGISLGVAKNQHFRMKEIYEKLPIHIQIFLFYFSNIFMIIFLTFVIRGGIQLMIQNWNKTFIVSGLPVIYFYFIIPFGSFLTILIIIFRLIKGFHWRIEE